MYENFNARRITCSFHMFIAIAILSFFFDHFLCFRDFNYQIFKTIINKIFKFAMRSHEKFVNKFITSIKQSFFINQLLCQRDFNYKIFNVNINDILTQQFYLTCKHFQKQQKIFILSRYKL